MNVVSENVETTEAPLKPTVVQFTGTVGEFVEQE